METIGYYVTHPDAVIYVTANALLYPVLILEVVLLVYALFEAGRFTAEMGARFRKRKLAVTRSSAEKAHEALMKGEGAAALAHLQVGLQHGRYARRFAGALSESDLTRTHLLKLLNDTELDASRRLEHTRMLVRFGPILGLMGTLIPISPALVALAQGDVQTLSDNLVIAFSTTVVGLLIGGIGYLVSTVRDRVYTQDMSDIEYALEILEA
jgi:biopolymer transport protein ExbB/TolQ